MSMNYAVKSNCKDFVKINVFFSHSLQGGPLRVGKYGLERTLSFSRL